jgi:hypothetical protein
MLKKCISLVVLNLLFVIPLQAQEIADAATALCEKVKSCAMSQVPKEQLTPETIQMMEPMFNNMCANMQAGVGDIPKEHELYGPAVACMHSMEALSCEMMMDRESAVTTECKEFEKLSQEYQPSADAPAQP